MTSPTGHWCIAATADVLARHPHPTQLLTPTEHTRANAFIHDSDRHDFIAAHLLIRETAAHMHDTHPHTIQLTQHCPLCHSNDHGRPTLTSHPGHISWSHTRGVIAAAAHPTHPIGIDVETWDNQPLDPDYLHGMLTSREVHAILGHPTPHQQALHLWTQKEALVKADPTWHLDDVIAAPLAVTLRSTPGLHLTTTENPTLTAVASIAHYGPPTSMHPPTTGHPQPTPQDTPRPTPHTPRSHRRPS